LAVGCSNKQEKENTAERIVVNLLPIWTIRVSLYQQSPPS